MFWMTNYRTETAVIKNVVEVRSISFILASKTVVLIAVLCKSLVGNAQG
jgi:hypothetical protein